MVGVFLKDYQGQGVIVLGAVARPGLCHLSRGGQTLIDVISMAGGLTQNAGNYILLRPADNAGNGSSHDVAMQGSALALAPAANSLSAVDPNTIVISAHPGTADPKLMALPMRSGDQVIVPEAGQAFIEGEVTKPGPVPLVYGMTLTQLISAVGGLTYPADRRHVTLIRSASAGESTQWEVDVDRIQGQQQPDVLLERNDRIVVPATGGRKVAYGAYQTLKDIVRFSVGGAATLY
jgi:polysaccharide export outer membrane protein